MAHKHWPKDHPQYRFAPTCNLMKKDCDELYVEAQAREQVALAARIVREGRGPRWRKDQTVFGQLIAMLQGERDTISNADGNESEAPFTRRLVRVARERLSEGTGA